MTLNLTDAHQQWAHRPADERFWTIADMKEATLFHARNSSEETIAEGSWRLDSRDGAIDLTTHDERYELGHYSFGQLCRALNAPSAYLRTMPSHLAVDCLEQSRLDKSQPSRLALVDRSSERLRLRALTSERYVRVWNHEICSGLEALEADGWVVPPARPTGHARPGETRLATEADCIDFGDSPLTVRPGDEIAPAGLYASDHDMFAFLIHPDVVIEDGLAPGGLRRGTMIRQSEVGDCAIWKQDFLFNTVCGNHIVWDARDVKVTRIRHMGSKVEDGWMAMIKDIAADTHASADQQQREIIRARDEIILGEGKDEIMQLLFGKRWATKRQAGKAYDLAVEYEHAHGNPRSLWGMVQGLTRLSQSTPYQDERTRLDVAAGKMLAACLG